MRCDNSRIPAITFSSGTASTPWRSKKRRRARSQPHGRTSVTSSLLSSVLSTNFLSPPSCPYASCAVLTSSTRIKSSSSAQRAGSQPSCCRNSLAARGAVKLLRFAARARSCSGLNICSIIRFCHKGNYFFSFFAFLFGNIVYFDYFCT